MADKIAKKFKEELHEKVVTGGGATGQSIGPEPTSKQAQAPGNSKRQGDLAPQKLEGEVQETDPQNNTKPTGDMSAKNKSSVSMKEDVEAMFAGQDLSEEFKEKATVVFEAAVNVRIDAVKEELIEQYDQAFEQAKEEIKQEVAEKVDEYLHYVVEQWMEENQLAVESSLRTEISEEFIAGLKQLFEEHNIDIPEEQVNVVEELAKRVEELEDKLNDQINENIELRKITDEVSKEIIFNEVSEGLAATQIEKLQALSEGIEFSDEESYVRKLNIIKENYFPNDKKQTQSLTEELEEETQQELPRPEVRGEMGRYVQAISRSIKK
jgi:hypothetical protein